MKTRLGLLVFLITLTASGFHPVVAKSNKYARCVKSCETGTTKCLQHCETKKKNSKEYKVCKKKACKVFKEYCLKNCRKRHGG